MYRAYNGTLWCLSRDKLQPQQKRSLASCFTVFFETWRFGCIESDQVLQATHKLVWVRMRVWGLYVFIYIHSENGIRIVNKEPPSKTPPESGRWMNLFYFAYFVLYCHFTACFTSHINVYFYFYLNIARGIVTCLLIFVDVYHLYYTFTHAYIYTHTHTRTHVWLVHRKNHENWAQEPDWKGQSWGFAGFSSKQKPSIYTRAHIKKTRLPAHLEFKSKKIWIQQIY